jgi:hypothetical protein
MSMKKINLRESQFESAFRIENTTKSFELIEKDNSSRDDVMED